MAEVSLEEHGAPKGDKTTHRAEENVDRDCTRARQLQSVSASPTLKPTSGNRAWETTGYDVFKQFQ